MIGAIMIAGVSVWRTRNIGDYVSSPLHYFDFGKPARRCDLADEPEGKTDAIIYGGGAIGLRLMKSPEWAGRARVSIAWGVGTSDARDKQAVTRAPAEWLDVFGSREWGQPGTTWVPCASCMSPLFDVPRPDPKYEAVLYANRDRPLRIARDQSLTIERGKVLDIPGLPRGHNWLTFRAALDHLASGETVVTDSYHGAYWALLLGRKAVLVAPYSSKFAAFRHRPAIAASAAGWRAAAKEARRYPEALEQSRWANRAFYASVMRLIHR